MESKTPSSGDWHLLSKCNISVNDLRLYVRALKEEWPISPPELLRIKNDAIDAMMRGSNSQQRAAKTVLILLKPHRR